MSQKSARMNTNIAYQAVPELGHGSLVEATLDSSVTAVFDGAVVSVN